jgi:hypothetical protein
MFRYLEINDGHAGVGLGDVDHGGIELLPLHPRVSYRKPHKIIRTYRRMRGNKPVLWMLDILVRIRIRGSVPLTIDLQDANKKLPVFF